MIKIFTGIFNKGVSLYKYINNRIEERKKRKKEEKMARWAIRKQEIIKEIDDLLDAKRRELGMPIPGEETDGKDQDTDDEEETKTAIDH